MKHTWSSLPLRREEWFRAATGGRRTSDTRCVREKKKKKSETDRRPLQRLLRLLRSVEFKRTVNRVVDPRKRGKGGGVQLAIRIPKDFSFFFFLEFFQNRFQSDRRLKFLDESYILYIHDPRATGDTRPNDRFGRVIPPWPFGTSYSSTTDSVLNVLNTYLE